MKPSVLVVLDAGNGLGPITRTKISDLGIPIAPASFDAIATFLPRSSERPYDRGWWQKGRLSRFSRTALGTALAENLGRRLESFQALQKRLGQPQSILCLGNGPSSEDSRLGDLQYDCLFRTNWRWKHRKVLDHPQFVFVGSFQTPLEVSACVFGFRDIESERVVLLRNLKRPWRRIHSRVPSRLPRSTTMIS